MSGHPASGFLSESQRRLRSWNHRRVWDRRMGVESMPRAGRSATTVRWAAGVVLGLVLSLLTTGTAAATCFVEPFDKVVRGSDTVLVATVAEARPAGPHRMGIIVRLDVEDVLKGSAADGERVYMSSCGPIMLDAALKSWAKREVGQRGLFLLSRYGATVSQFSGLTSPQGMFLDQQIARARHVLGLPDAASAPNGAAGASGASGNLTWQPWAIGAGLTAAVGATLFFIRRARRR
jgi:hypothetical protein